MINNLPQSLSIQWASGLLQATSSPKDNGAISCGVRGREPAREKQASIVKQGHHISVSCPWSERQIQAYSESRGLFAGSLQGKTGAKSARHQCSDPCLQNVQKTFRLCKYIYDVTYYRDRKMERNHKENFL